MMKTCLLVIFLMFIGNGLAFTRQKPASYVGPLGQLWKRVGWSLYKFDQKICDAQDDIVEIKEEQETQNGRLDKLEEKDMSLMTDISNLKVKDRRLMKAISDLQDTVGEVGEDGNPSTGLVLDVENLQEKQVELCEDVEDLWGAVIPVQCYADNYNVLNDVGRNVDSDKDNNDRICDTTDTGVPNYNPSHTNANDHGWKGNAWYRFEEYAGTMMPITPYPKNKCGTGAPGWLATPHPTHDYETIPATYCFSSATKDCNWHTEGLVTHCGSYFVYYLPNVATLLPKKNVCHLGYCGIAM